MNKPSQPPNGFTLVEILIVLTVIGVLAALLFPVFTRVRENARKAQCASNLKQLGLAWQMYADDCDGKAMPSANIVGGNHQLWTGIFQTPKDSTIAPGTGLLHPWLKTDKVLSCPSWPRDEDSIHKDADVQGYGYNSSVFRSQTNAHPDRTTPLSSIEKPSEMVVFADAASIAGANNPLMKPSLLSSTSVTSPSAGLPNFHGRHNGEGNVLWADGHVKPMQPLYIESPRGRTAKLQQSFQVGFIDRDGQRTTNEFFDLNPDAK